MKKQNYHIQARDILGWIFGWYKDKDNHYRVPDGFQVHHIDGDCTNNSLDNLSVLTTEEHRLLHNTNERSVVCVETNIAYESLTEASRQTGANRNHIRSVCNGVCGRKTAGGYHWRWC